MLDNLDIAILTKLNELADRCGLKAYDFVATVQTTEEGKTALAFEMPAQGNALREERLEKMMRALGVDKGGLLKGSPNQVIDALDNALQLAPNPRLRF